MWPESGRSSVPSSCSSVVLPAPDAPTMLTTSPLSMACIRYRLTPEEALNATTLNTAYAMGVSDILGSVAVGKKANFYITKPIPTYEYLPYAYGENKVARTFLNGKEV